MKVNQKHNKVPESQSVNHTINFLKIQWKSDHVIQCLEKKERKNNAIIKRKSKQKIS